MTCDIVFENIFKNVNISPIYGQRVYIISSSNGRWISGNALGKTVNKSYAI
jgi:hypothetical protein